MDFKIRKIGRPDGSVELKLSVVLQPDEIEGALRICDDPSITLDVHRLASKESLFVRVDQALCWLRILLFWVGIWGDKDSHSRFIVDSIRAREAKLRKPRRKKRERKPRRKPR